MKKITLIVLIGLLVFVTISCKKPSDKEYHVDKSSCTACGECIDACDYDAIEFDTDGKAVIDQSKCKACGDCIKVCPEGAIY